jgi:hypothetical protein
LSTTVLPAQERRRGRPAGERHGKIEGRDHPPDAVGLEGARVAVALALAALGFDKAAVRLHHVAVGADKVGRFLHIAQRLQPVLAHLQAVHRGDVEETLADQLGDAAQQRDPFRPGCGAPGREGGARRPHRTVDVAGVAVLEMAHDDAGVDGAVGGEGVRCGAPLAVDVKHVRLAQVGAGRGDGLLVVFVEQRVRAAQSGVGDFDMLAWWHGFASVGLMESRMTRISTNCYESGC